MKAQRRSRRSRRKSQPPRLIISHTGWRGSPPLALAMPDCQRPEAGQRGRAGVFDPPTCTSGEVRIGFFPAAESVVSFSRISARAADTPSYTAMATPAASAVTIA